MTQCLSSLNYLGDEVSIVVYDYEATDAPRPFTAGLCGCSVCIGRAEHRVPQHIRINTFTVRADVMKEIVDLYQRHLKEPA